MRTFLTGVEAVRALCKALDIDPDAQPVRRLVIDASVDNVVTVHVQFLATAEQVAAVSAAVADAPTVVAPASAIDVDDFGNVRATP